MSELNVLLSSKEFKALPKDMQATLLRELNRSNAGYPARAHRRTTKTG